MTNPHSGTPAQFNEDLDTLAELLAAEGIETSGGQQIQRRDASVPTPMSFSQELLWLLDRATPGLTAYNMPLSRRLRGPLDARALEAALGSLVARHEVLRTRFVEEGTMPVQIVDAAEPFTLSIVDASGETEADRLADAQRIVRARARTPFDLAHEHLFRATLVRLAPDDHVLVIETHHIVMDGWSIGLAFREIGETYEAVLGARATSLSAPGLQFGDYAAWQRAQLSGPRLDALLEFWRAQLGDATDPLSLPTDKRRTTATGFAGDRQSIVLDTALTSSIKQLAQRENATLYMLLLAAYATVLHRYTGKENVLIGSGSAGRTLPETETLIGYVNNTLVQRADFSGDPSIRQLLARVRESALAAYDHQDIPLEKLVLELRRDDAQRSHAPLFEVVLTMQDTMSSPLAMRGLTVEPFGADLGATKFDITLLASERDGTLHLTSQYRSELFTPATMQRFLGHLRRVLAATVANAEQRISEIDLLTDAERSQFAHWNDTRVDEGRPVSLVALLEEQVARVAHRPAIVAPGIGESIVTLTYAELNARANRLAHHLRSCGVDGNASVGLLLDGSAEALVALVAIIKAGGAYVPLSVDAPATRIAQQLDQSRARIVVTVAALSDRLPTRVRAVLMDGGADVRAMEGQPDTNPPALATSESLAYVLFTSGSTGVPKGVAVSHGNAVHYARAVSRVLGDVWRTASGDGFAPLDGWHFGLASTLAADLGNTSLLASLLAGGTLHVLGKRLTTEPERFQQYMQSNRLDLIKITPSHLVALTTGRTGAELGAVLPRRWVVVGGEALRPDVARTILGAQACRLLNHYGPTETTVGACTFEVTTQSLDDVEAYGAQTVPVGLPMSNTHTYVVDAHGNELPIAIPGELWIGGDGVARGYLDRDDLTRQRFTEHRGDRVYHTGDHVRRLENGAIEFLGRADDQVKVRGFRVELGEIAHALRAHPGVQDALAVLRHDAAGEPQIVAYVVAKHAGYAVSHTDRPSSGALVEWTAAQLPAYMVPSAVVLLDAFPLTLNGKLDTNALPAPNGDAAATAQFVPPRTPAEKELAAIWADVLKRDRVGVTDNFIALGGHSLMAIRVLGRISKTFGVRLTLRALFEAPTVRQLATLLEAEGSTSVAPVSAGISSVSRDAHRIGRPVSPTGDDGKGGPAR